MKQNGDALQLQLVENVLKTNLGGPNVVHGTPLGAFQSTKVNIHIRLTIFKNIILYTIYVKEELV